MSVNNDELIAKIEEWKEEISDNNKHIHFALLEIFIEFEKFLTKAFITYSLGGEGKNSFSPDLRITFENEEHLEGFLKCDKQYIDYLKKIQEIKGFIFREDICPFKKIFSEAKFITLFKEIQILRNFIAHQSKESKDKYQNKVLRPIGINQYIKVTTFLLRRNRQQNISYYSIYINAIKFYSEIICDPKE
ncbi:MAG: hypothetical protein Q9M36_09845 [Sulfurovum sp.]|nr:hypothetical protein [Sulfurovum sp.]